MCACVWINRKEVNNIGLIQSYIRRNLSSIVVTAPSVWRICSLYGAVRPAGIINLRTKNNWMTTCVQSAIDSMYTSARKMLITLARIWCIYHMNERWIVLNYSFNGMHTYAYTHICIAIVDRCRSECRHADPQHSFVIDALRAVEIENWLIVTIFPVLYRLIKHVRPSVVSTIISSGPRFIWIIYYIRIRNVRESKNWSIHCRFLA